jgi:predicted phosphodiesterase
MTARWIAVAGDVHGALDRLGELLERFARAVGRRVDLLLQVGDLELPEDAPAFPFETIFVSGNHETWERLDLPAPGFTYVGRAGVVERLGLRIGGLSGIHHPAISEGPGPGRREHGTRADVAALLALGAVDVLLVHDWPQGVLADKDRARLRPAPRSAALVGSPHARLAVDRLAPPWVFAGHHHVPYARDWDRGDGHPARVRCLADVASGPSSVAFLAWDGRTLEESAPLEELEAFARAGRGRSRGARS